MWVGVWAEGGRVPLAWFGVVVCVTPPFWFPVHRPSLLSLSLSLSFGQRELGHGGHCKVLLARLSGEPVALKMLAADDSHTTAERKVVSRTTPCSLLKP